MRVIIQKDYENMSKWAAQYIAKTINDFKPNAKKPFVLGLPTGSSPIGTYKELIKLNKIGVVSFKDVVTFNMDEYVGLKKDHSQSYWTFMHENFFDHVDINKANIHILNGMAQDLQKECYDYEKTIASFGGIDLFLGGIGVDGHIAFNEPFSSLSSKTRVKTLTEDTIIVNSRFFDYDVKQVPKQALTVGVKTVMDSKQVLVLVNGHNKAAALEAVVEGNVSQKWTCSALQMHPKAIIACDENACGQIKVDTYKYFKDIEKTEIL